MVPNIVFITCHDLGRHLNCYGRATVASPNLDELAARGVLMENAYCTAPQCSPSRSALHTGRHAHSNGVMGLTHPPFNWRLNPGETHLAQRLRGCGYSTALIGEQHLTLNAYELGYDVVIPRQYAPATAANARDTIVSLKGQRQPFYLEVGFVEPHRPYDWGGAAPDRRKGVGVPAYLSDTPEARRDFADLQGAIAVLDAAVGEVVHAVRESGLEDNTWVIFTVDHGLAMPRAKSTLYDPGLEVAVLMHYPAGGLAGGKRFAEMVSHVDMVPTLLEGCGLPLHEGLHGRSYWPLLQGQAYTPNPAVFAEKTFHTAYEPMRAVRTDRYKLIVNFEAGSQIDVADDIRLSPIYPQMLDRITGQRRPVELYDLSRDPLEQDNLAGLPDTAEVERALKKMLLEWMESTGDPLLLGPVPSPFYHAARGELRGG